MSVSGINDPIRHQQLSRPNPNRMDTCAKAKKRQCKNTTCSLYIQCPLTALADTHAKEHGHDWGAQYDLAGLSNTSPDREAKHY